MPSQLSNQKTEDIPLCCCKIDGTTFEYMAECTYCQALDSIDGKVCHWQFQKEKMNVFSDF